VLDERVRAVLARLEAEDAREREEGVPRERRARQVAATTGRFLFSLVAPNAGCEVLEVGGSRGYSTIWLAAAARILGGSVVSLERDPEKCEAWRRNVEEAGLADWAELLEGDAFATLGRLEEPFDVVFLDAEKEDYERLFALVRARLEPGAVVVADNVVSHADTLAAYSAARQADASLLSVTVPLDRGLELSAVLS
jgi:predicted O-methyltransferase YrrM